MVLAQEHLGEISHSQAVYEALVCGGQKLQAVKRSREGIHASEDCCFQEGLAEVLVYMEQDDLTVTPADANLVGCHSLDTFDALCANILGKD